MPAAETLLVTGGTGALGRELVRRLAAAGWSRLVVLSRSARKPDPRLAAGVAVVRGDLQAGPSLGLSSAARDTLAREVTGILHCAADTRFTLPLAEARATNVGGTRALLDFAGRCRALERIGCLSTVYVAGRRTGPVAEEDLDDGGAGFANAYERSKHEMEREVRRRMADLPIAVYRASTLIGDSRTGAVTVPNAFHHALCLLHHGLAPMVPGRAENTVDLVATDYVADAVALLFRDRFDPGRTFHLCSGRGAPRLDDLIGAAMAALDRLRPEWRRRRVETPAIVDPATYALFVRTVEEAGNEILLRATHAVGSFADQLACPKTFDTRGAEAALAGSGLCPPPVLELLPRVVEHCLEAGWKEMAT